MVKNKNGLSHEFIIHPGETLKEIIEDRDMSQKELAVRTGNSPKHISDVVNCIKPISVNFAKKLEYALSIDASFWINLQANYDKEVADFEELNHITDEEIKIAKRLNEVSNYLVSEGFLIEEVNKASKVVELRKLLNISSLESIPEIITTGAFRVSSRVNADPYVLFAWLRMCELYAERIEIKNSLDTELLINKIPEIKALIFEKPNIFMKKLEKIFGECGIKFLIVKHFKGAPVQGVITKNSDESLSLIMTIRGAQADRFWFTLMHEIAHIINGDIKKKLIDYDKGENSQEIKADKVAGSILLDDQIYERFVNEKDFSLTKIKQFAKANNVEPFIVIGRLQKEEYLSYSMHQEEKTRYKWNE